MKEKKIDRRVKYTLNSLINAMIELLQKEHISKISVVALCKIADVNRSTFYTHFEDQYHLLNYITQEALNNIQTYLQELDYHNNGELPVQTIKEILDYVQENADIFKALLSDNCDPDIQRKVMRITEIVSPEDYKGLDKRTKDYFILYQINGCISILHKWLQDDTPETTEEMSQLILKLLGKVPIARK